MLHFTKEGFLKDTVCYSCYFAWKLPQYYSHCSIIPKISSSWHLQLRRYCRYGDGIMDISLKISQIFTESEDRSLQRSCDFVLLHIRGSPTQSCVTRPLVDLLYDMVEQPPKILAEDVTCSVANDSLGQLYVNCIYANGSSFSKWNKSDSGKRRRLRGMFLIAQV